MSDKPTHVSYSTAEFNTLRQWLGIPDQWLAERAGVEPQVLQDWENGESPIPDEVMGIIKAVDDVRRTVVNGIVENIGAQLRALESEPGAIAMLRYKAQEDLEEYWPEMVGMPLEAHVMALGEIKSRLEAEVPEIAVWIVYFDKTDYMDWLDGGEDNPDARALYAADKAEGV